MRWGAFGAAAAAVASMLLSAPAPSRSLQSRVSVTLHAHQTGALAVTPFGAILEARNLTVNQRRATKLAVRNITDAPLLVRARAAAENGDADEILDLRVGTRGRVLIGGLLGSARRWSADALRIEPGQTRRLTVAIGVGATAGTGLIGRARDVTIELDTRRAPR